MKPILALLLAIQSTAVFADAAWDFNHTNWDHPKLRANGMPESQMQVRFNAQAGQCGGQAVVLANSVYPIDPHPYGTWENMGAGINAATGARVAQRQEEKEQLFLNSYRACLFEKGWI